MAFLIYKKSIDAGNARYEYVAPLKFGGRTGLVAEHVRALPESNQRSWKLATPDLLKLAGGPPGEDHVVLFDVAGKESTSVCLYELRKLHGSCRDTSTQLALDFAVVIDQEVGESAAAYARKFEVALPAQPRLLGETLSLSGGPGGGDWKWGAPPLQLGATIVHAQPHHGGGEPCPNCTCRRRAATA